MKSLFYILSLLLTAALSGCNIDSEKSGRGNIYFTGADVTQNGESIKAIQLSNQSTDIKLHWSVFSNISDYTIKIWLGSREFPEKKDLLLSNCSTSGGNSQCGSEHTHSCSIDEKSIDCRDENTGKRHFLDDNHETIYFEACIYDITQDDANKYVCDVEEITLDTFSSNDIRLDALNNTLPNDWVKNGMPKAACESKSDSIIVGCYRSNTCYRESNGSSFRYWVDILADGEIKAYQHEFPNSMICSGGFIPVERSLPETNYEEGESVFIKNGTVLTEEEIEKLEEDEEFTEQFNDEIITEAVELDITQTNEGIDTEFYSYYQMENQMLCLPVSDFSWKDTAIGLNFSNLLTDKGTMLLEFHNTEDDSQFDECLLKR